MIKNIVFDFGGVLLDWNPRYLFGPYFKDDKKCDYFLNEICPVTWNNTMDVGTPIHVACAQKVKEFPEWELEIYIYYYGWYKMIGKEIPGMYKLECELKRKGYGIYGLSNWSVETFPVVEGKRIFRILDGYVVSGREKVVKPSPEIYRLLMDRYSLKAEECVYFDDVQHNVDGALAVGISGRLFTGEKDCRKALRELGVTI